MISSFGAGFWFWKFLRLYHCFGCNAACSGLSEEGPPKRTTPKSLPTLLCCSKITLPIFGFTEAALFALMLPAAAFHRRGNARTLHFEVSPRGIRESKSREQGPARVPTTYPWKPWPLRFKYTRTMVSGEIFHHTVWYDTDLKAAGMNTSTMLRSSKSLMMWALYRSG